MTDLFWIFTAQVAVFSLIWNILLRSRLDRWKRDEENHTSAVEYWKGVVAKRSEELKKSREEVDQKNGEIHQLKQMLEALAEKQKKAAHSKRPAGKRKDKPAPWLVRP